jgi:ATP-binding cassette subfamily B protein
MNYDLSQFSGRAKSKTPTFAALKKLLAFMSEERRKLYFALSAILINAAINLVGPFIIGHAIDKFVQTKQYKGVLIYSGILLLLYVIGLLASYLQTKLMGGVGQRLLFKLRNGLFSKLLELPVAFFNQNKAGDLISRVNNDTDKLNQFFSQSLMQFISSIFIMAGAGIFLLSINLKLGAAALGPALLLWIFTRLISPWVKQKNAMNLKSTGSMSAEIQESLNNFKVIVAFNRRDYFRAKFQEANDRNYSAGIGAGFANTIFIPVYGLCSNAALLIVLVFGIFLVGSGQFTIGLLISFIAYVNNFYNPLRQLAALWANFQLALAGWDRISQILSLESDMGIVVDTKNVAPSSLLEFRNVHFSYPGGKEVLQEINFNLEKGKTYAFVGPTGGGKTTTASLIARLYDPTRGVILVNGRDLRTFSAEERSRDIGFILQEPFLFSGSVRDNILYGNEYYKDYSNLQLEEAIRDANLDGLLSRFETGLESKVTVSGDGISLGQKQLIAFMRAVLRKPQLLILDEATANIDTITEKLLEGILQNLPDETTLVIIAHRLNTIENADEIFFVNSGQVIRAGSLDDAVNMLLHGERKS